MISQLLMYKILQLFVVMLLGFVLAKCGIVKSRDSVILSKLSLYLFMPAIIINAFDIEVSGDVVNGLALSFGAAVLIHIALLGVDAACKKIFKCTNVERASVVYSNCGNLIVPIVTYVLGEEWVIYSCGYLIVQIIFLWTHGVRLFSEKEKLNLKKILLNVNVIVVFVCFAMLFAGFRVPAFAKDITTWLGSMLTPAGMIVAGMLAAEIDFGKIFKNKRLYLVTVGRLIVCPLVILVVIKAILAVVNIENAYNILLISFFATIAPSASTVMMFSQLYNKDEDYAVAINVVTTIVCVVTMPLLAILF